MANLLNLDQLFEGAELEPQFAEKLKAVFTTAVNEKVHTILEEAAKEPYAVGMAQAMKSTGDTPPLEKDTIALAHKIAKAIMKNEEITEQEDEAPEGEEAQAEEVPEDEVQSAVDKFYQAVEELSKDMDIRRIMRAADISVAEFIRTLKATTVDLEGNKLAAPMVNLLSGLFNAIANDSMVAARIAKSISDEQTEEVETVEEVQEVEEAEEAPVAEQVIDEDLMESLVERMDIYFNYLADHWLEENKVEVENGIKVELAEQVIKNIKEFYTQHNVTNIPSVDLKDNLEKQVKVTENKLNEQIEKNAMLLQEKKEFLKKEIVSEVTSDLTESQKEKFSKLSDVVVFESEEDYKNQLNVLKENILANKSVIKQDKNLENNVVITENDEKPTAMKKYMDTISRGVKWE